MITKKNLDSSDKDFWIRYCTTKKYDGRQRNGCTLYNTLLTSTTASSVSLILLPPLAAYKACI